MHSFRSTEGSGHIVKGLVSLLILVVFAFGLQLGQAYGGTVTVSYSGEIQSNDGAPVRIAVDPTIGHIYTTSPLLGNISEYDANGNYLSDIIGFAGPLSIAADGNGHLFVGDSKDGSVSVLDLNAGFLYSLGAGPGEFGLPGDIAVSQSGLAFVTDSSNDRVRVYNAATGIHQFSFGTYGSGTGQFKFPAGIACDNANQEVYVVDQNNGRVQVFNFSGTYKRAVGSFGAGNGKLTRPQGVFVKDGFVYVADAYQSVVEVFKSDGTFVAFVGEYGSGVGQFRIPMDVAVDGSTLFVTNSDNMRIELFDISYFYSISGSVKTSGGVGIQNVVVTLSGDASRTATTDINGNYTISNLIPGSYTLTPSATGFAFTSPLNVVITGADLTAQNFTVASYNVSGAVTTSSGGNLAGVLMTLTGTTTNGGTVTKTATTATAGTYTLSDVLPGSYTLTPSKSGWSFTPASVTVSNANVTQNFIVQVYTISGVATTGSGVGISAVSVAIYIGGVKKSATTVATTGLYTITDVPVGSYTVTPTKTGYIFTPLNQAVTVSNANVTGINFNSFTLSGTVKNSTNTALSGVLMTLSGGGLTANKTATTSATGTYSILGLGNGTYTLTPSKAGYTFTPASVTVSNADATQDFSVQVYSISGNVTTGGGAGISAVSVAIYIGTVKKTATTAVTTGAYTITDVPPGSYTATPTKTGYAFAPVSQAVTVDTANVTGVNFNSFTLSGTVKTSNNTAISGVLMTLSGGGLTANKTATTSATGAYSILGLGNGTYTLTPSKAGYTFTPASVTVSGADAVQNFSVQVYSISGSVTTGSGTGISAASVAIYIGTVKKTATTATNGTYTLTDVPPGSYTVTPTKTAYCFTPTTQAVTVDTANVTGVNFNSFTLSGTVKTSNNTAISGVVVTLSGGGLTANRTATTTSTGAYTFPGLCNGSYTVTPSKAGYAFTPASVTVSGADAVQNFSVQVYSISGTVKTLANVGISGVSVKIYIGGVAKTATSAATTGAYTLADVPLGTYTVKPSKATYCFTPAAKVVTLSSSNVIQNFTGAVCGTTAMSVIGAAKGPDVTNDAVIRVLDLSGNLLSEFQTLSSYYGAKVAMGDLLGDGNYELIVSPGRGSQNAAQMQVYSYDGTLLASLASIANTAYGASVVSGDIDGDGKDEIVMSRLASDMVTHTINIYSVGTGYLLTQDATISFLSTAPVSAPANVAVGDLDGAGALELIVSYMSGNGTTNTVSVYTFDALMNPTLRGNNSYPLGSTVSAMNNGGGAIEDIVLGYTDSIDSIVKSVDIDFTEVVAPVTVFVNGGSAPALSAMDINSDGTLDLLAGMGDQPANPATLKIYPSGASPVDITAFESSVRGVNADFGVIIR